MFINCTLTSSPSPGPSRLLTHIRYRHMAVKPHECGLCHKTFKTASALSEHIETHREPSCVCTFPDCDYKASSTRALDRHVQSLHASDSMLYCCHVCNERFTVGKKLTQHLKTSHGFQLPPGHCRFRWVLYSLEYQSSLESFFWLLLFINLFILTLLVT